MFCEILKLGLLKLGESKKNFGHIFKSLYRFDWRAKIRSEHPKISDQS
jgi:hypothetical protein